MISDCSFRQILTLDQEQKKKVKFSKNLSKDAKLRRLDDFCRQPQLRLHISIPYPKREWKTSDLRYVI